MKATVIFRGDSSVGIFPRSFTIQLPFDKETLEDYGREEARARISNLYEDFDNEERCHVMFDDEDY